MPLSDSDYEVLTFIEQEYHLGNGIPSADLIAKELSLPPKNITKLLDRKDFNVALTSRGIRREVKSRALTSEQLTCINTLLDQNDTRSDKKKLADLGIATQTYQGWCRDPAFALYLQQRTEALFPDGLNEANRALVDNVRRGDLGSIKLIYEMTGRWSSKPTSEMNIEMILMKVLETIQRHVTDPDALTAIAEDLSMLHAEAVPVAAGLNRWTGPSLALEPVHSLSNSLDI